MDYEAACEVIAGKTGIDLYLIKTVLWVAGMLAALAGCKLTWVAAKLGYKGAGTSLRYVFSDYKGTPAYQSAARALADESAVYERETGVLYCTGLAIKFSLSDLCSCRSDWIKSGLIMKAKEGGAWSGSNDLKAILDESEIARLEKAAWARAIEIRDLARIQANKDAADAIEFHVGAAARSPVEARAASQPCQRKTA